MIAREDSPDKMEMDPSDTEATIEPEDLWEESVSTDKV